MPDDYFMGSTTVQQKVGLQNIKSIEELIQLRKVNGLTYNKFLREIGKWNYSDEVLGNHSFLKYPIFVKDRDAFMKKAEKSKIRLGDWFLSPIHPVSENFELWNLTIQEFPQSRHFSTHILNLPTDTKNSEKVISFLKANKEDLL
jgi:dTDP-4-amino-4,6-dideoxygalactose transaminase